MTSQIPRLSSRLRDWAIQSPNLGAELRSLLFEAADDLEADEPIPYRLVVKESGVS